MDGYSFIAGFLCGLAAVAGLPALRTWIRRRRTGLGPREELLLSAARTAGGRLIFRLDPLIPQSPLLQLKEFSQPGPMENRGQMQRLLARGFLEPDGSGLPERYVLTAAGWALAGRLPPAPLVASRQGAWYNSISRRPRRPTRRA